MMITHDEFIKMMLVNDKSMTMMITIDAMMNHFILDYNHEVYHHPSCITRDANVISLHSLVDDLSCEMTRTYYD